MPPLTPGGKQRRRALAETPEEMAAALEAFKRQGVKPLEQSQRAGAQHRARCQRRRDARLQHTGQHVLLKVHRSNARRASAKPKAYRAAVIRALAVTRPRCVPRRVTHESVASPMRRPVSARNVGLATVHQRCRSAAAPCDEEEQVKALSADELAGAPGGAAEVLAAVLQLRWRDVEFGEPSWLNVRRRFYRGTVGLPKGRKRRRIKISQRLSRQLWRLRSETRASDDDLVWTAEKGGRIDQGNLSSRVLKPAAVKAAIGDWVGFHTFRHTAATRLFLSGWNAKQVQGHLGHSDAGFTLRVYVHLLPADLPEPPAVVADLKVHAEGGHEGATRPAEISRDHKLAKVAESVQ